MTRSDRPLTYYQPRHCADCRVDVGRINEWFMVHDNVFEQAWPGHGVVPFGHAILCIGCLEHRLGRTLTRPDFTDAPVNDIFDNDFDSFSDRLLNRLCADV
jgi:hypothetical protein